MDDTMKAEVVAMMVALKSEIQMEAGPPGTPGVSEADMEQRMLTLNAKWKEEMTTALDEIWNKINDKESRRKMRKSLTVPA